MHSDKEIIEGIAAHKSKVLKYIYKELYPYVETYILQHGGSVDQAKDIFQDAMIIVYRKIVDGKFTLHCKFNTYLYAISKRLWIQDRRKEYLRINKLKEHPMVSESSPAYGTDNASEVHDLFNNHFEKLDPECKQILQLYFNGLTPEEIQKIMGISNLHQMADKKYRCKKVLIKRIMEDPKFRKFKNG